MARGIDAAAHRGALAAAGRRRGARRRAGRRLSAGRTARLYRRDRRGRRRDLRAARRAPTRALDRSRPATGSWPRSARRRSCRRGGAALRLADHRRDRAPSSAARSARSRARSASRSPRAPTPDRDGAHLIRDARDVLDLLLGVGRSSAPPTVGPPLEPELAVQVSTRSSAGATTVDRVIADASRSARGDAAVALARLELLGYVRGGRARALHAHGARAPPAE